MKGYKALLRLAALCGVSLLTVILLQPGQQVLESVVGGVLLGIGVFGWDDK